jgi:hypothetical protein
MLCRRVLSIAATLVVAGSTILVGAVAADTETTPHPAGVHGGSCPDVGEVVAPLGDVSSRLLVEGTATVTEPVDPSGAAIPVEASVTTIPIAYADLLAAPHSIVVRQSAEELTISILCGDIGGAGMGPADLVFGLGPVGDSGYTGVAMLHDNADGTTRVSADIVAPQVIGATE